MAKINLKTNKYVKTKLPDTPYAKAGPCIVMSAEYKDNRHMLHVSLADEGNHSLETEKVDKLMEEFADDLNRYREEDGKPEIYIAGGSYDENNKKIPN